MLSAKQKIVVMGLGYIGLPTASMLATKGHKVLGVDINPQTVETINQGNIHIVEPDLDILVRSAVNSGNLKASLTPEEADTFIIAVPTPFMQTETNPKAPDISYVESATRAIALFLKPGNLIILESTSPVGTTERIAEIIKELRPDLYNSTFNIQNSPLTSDATADARRCTQIKSEEVSEVLNSKSKIQNPKLIHIAHCPERVLPGHIIRELVDNDRIIGGIDNASALKAQELYKSFCNGNIFLTDAKTAEMAKLVENSFRDVNIAFANELSMICDKLNINVWELIDLANKHPRVNILQPGPGVGGHCIAVDPWFIVDAAPDQAKLIRTARQVNDSKPHWIIDKVKEAVEAWHIAHRPLPLAPCQLPVIACLGLAFKANIDDLRESPAMAIVRNLISSGIGQVMACEPNVNDGFEEFPLFELNEVLKEADILLVLVDHQEFKTIDQELLKEKVVIDTRGVWR